ncbi:alpha/beta-hydrolase [Neurospora crassa]|uniref:Alpha/beta hydrolase n=2 Tax=Neurospora crassa TaxID=5141 RepID=Q1K8N9_NEUCR|nr:alpha/beta hydrolase [Neurospora crassa OR74A]EAA34170.3 alpha/beta hydrolase [Neurospora crassa OR74A]KHE82422.1 alpha/beta-hydrolase [Neurospora crassa]CAD70514.1 related to 3-OXOADIPATE ENOL-LACTONASE I [Neurospora crassa]|eukprot:XP_963406.3 alpha/beta hydrolase [Neurospora crassa OR74A]
MAAAKNGQGMLYVTMQPQEGLSLDQFHEWYNNEHGPTRLRLPQIFSNGLRYQATDGQQPHFLAAYDVTDMAHLLTPTYLDLRANRSSREAETIGQVKVDRFFFDLIWTQEAPSFKPAEQCTDAEAEGRVLVAVDVSLNLTQEPDAAEKVIQWYQEEHIPMLSKIPGWLRSRVLRTPSSIEGSNAGETKIITLHEYAAENGLGGPEHKASMDTPWRTEVFNKYITTKGRRTYSLFYVFGPAPRDLQHLAALPASAAFSAASPRLTTTPGTSSDGPIISSYITTPHDGLVIPYQLEGNPSPSAPVIAFSNSLLTSLHMWDPLVKLLKASRPDLRILRYDTRGRHSIPSPPQPATLDLLADDLASLLDALRINKLQTLVGVSMGGATTLNFAIRHPSRLQKFVACDFNAASSEANTQAWKDRIAVAEADEGRGLRDQLAGVTVERWFHPNTMEKKKEVVQWMTEMVAGNSVEGFRWSCQALWGYDLREKMREVKGVEGLFVVGEGDGKGALVKAMEGFRGLLGEKGAELKVVKEAGHLPMCECPEGFWEVVKDFI